MIKFCLCNLCNQILWNTEYCSTFVIPYAGSEKVIPPNSMRWSIACAQIVNDKTQWTKLKFCMLERFMCA